MQPITSPFRWQDDPRPSIFALDPHFWPKRKHAPKPQSQMTIMTPAQVDRTNSIKRQK